MAEGAGRKLAAIMFTDMVGYSALAQRRDDAMAAAELRRAHDLYVEIGAEGHAERLAEGIGVG